MESDKAKLIIERESDIMNLLGQAYQTNLLLIYKENLFDDFLILKEDLPGL